MKLAYSEQAASVPYTFTGVMFYSFVFSLLIILPLFPPELTKWYTAFYVVVLFITILVSHKLTFPRRAVALSALILSQFFALFTHANDADSVINLVARLVSIVALAFLARACIRIMGHGALLRQLYVLLGISVAAMFIVSTTLTAIHWPTMPSYFFWEAFTSDKRLLVMADDTAGHSNILWISMLMTLFTISYCASKGITALRLFTLVPLALILFSSKSRVALLFLVIVVVAVASYTGMIRHRVVIACTPFVLCAVFFAGIFAPGVQSALSDAASNLQDQLPSLRIKGSSTGTSTGIYTGRDVLNLLLLRASADHPFIGHGHSSPYLKWSIGRHGQFTTGSKIAARDESWLRMPVAYGWPYSLCVMGFLTVPLVRAVQGYYRDNVFVIAAISTIIVCVITEGGMEHFYGISALYLFLVLIFYFSPRVARDEQLA